MLEPYEYGSGTSSAYTDFIEYKNGEIKVRIDSEKWWLRRNPGPIYKKEL